MSYLKKIKLMFHWNSEFYYLTLCQFSYFDSNCKISQRNHHLWNDSYLPTFKWSDGNCHNIKTLNMRVNRLRHVKLSPSMLWIHYMTYVGNDGASQEKEKTKCYWRCVYKIWSISPMWDKSKQPRQYVWDGTTVVCLEALKDLGSLLSAI